MEKKGYFLCYLSILFVVLYFVMVPQVFFTDEATYILAVDSVGKVGLPVIDNFIGNKPYDELNVFGKDRITIDGKKFITTIFPPLYPYLAFPFYELSGISGLIVLNIVSFILTGFLVYHLSEKLFGSEFAILSAVIYTASTYSTVLALYIMPHSVSVFLIFLSSTLIVLYDESSILAAAGFLAGAAVGVRYPNAIIALVLLFYAERVHGLKKAAFFCSGFMVPLFFISWINNIFFGSFFATGYTSGHSFEIFDTFPALVASFVVFFFSLFFLYFLGKKFLIKSLSFRSISERIRGNPKLILYLGAFFLLLCDPKRIRIILSLLLVFGLNPIYHTLTDQINPRSIIQSSPILILSLVGFNSLYKKGKIRSVLALFLAIPVFEVLFYSYFSYQGGNGVFMRYLLESVPYLTIFASEALLGIFKSLKSLLIKLFDPIYLSLFFFFSILILSDISSDNFFLKALPVVLSLSLLLSYILSDRSKMCRSLSRELAVVCILYSISVNVTFLSVFAMHRNYERQDNIWDVLKPSSVVLYSEKDVFFSLASEKIKKNITLAQTTLGNETTNVAFLGGLRRMGVPAYMVDVNRYADNEFNFSVREVSN